MNKHIIGSINEAKAALYYLKQGYCVYWPAVQQSPVDFVVEKDKVLLKVQVKTAVNKRIRGGEYLQCNI